MRRLRPLLTPAAIVLAGLLVALGTPAPAEREQALARDRDHWRVRFNAERGETDRLRKLVARDYPGRK